MTTMGSFRASPGTGGSLGHHVLHFTVTPAAKARSLISSQMNLSVGRITSCGDVGFDVTGLTAIGRLRPCGFNIVLIACSDWLMSFPIVMSAAPDKVNPSATSATLMSAIALVFDHFPAQS